MSRSSRIPATARGTGYQVCDVFVSEARSVEPPVARLLRSVAGGDRAAFDTLYGQFLSPVSRLVRLLMRDIAMADEVTQEVFLGVWLAAGRFDPQRGEGSAWILGMARSRAIDRIRSAEAARRRDQHYAVNQHQAQVTTHDLVQQRLDGAIVREALWVLTTKQRQALLLAFFGGHSYQEVADLLGVPLPTVKTRIRDGIRRLRAHLGPPGSGPGQAQGPESSGTIGAAKPSV